MLSRRKFAIGSTQTAATLPLLASPSGAFAAAQMITLPLPCGELEGIRGNGFRRFLGIPFAQPPVGELRFKAPRPLDDWQGVRQAFGFAKGSIQQPRSPRLVPNDPGYSEDCLYLNVWAPDAPGTYPVYVWIHGGGNAEGTTAQPIFDGESFARRGIVLVSVAYRLGILGFLDVSSVLGNEYSGSGNNGLRDLVQALKWIRRNISVISGDPSRVTIGGESAGGKNVISLMSMPAAKGLFHRAICQSGGGQTFADQTMADDLTRLVLENLPVTADNPEALLEISADALLAAQMAIIKGYPAKSPFRAVIDGVVLNEPPLQAIAGGASEEVPLLLGSNRDEAAYYGPSKNGDGEVTTADLANLTLERFYSIFAAYRSLFPTAGAETLRWKALTAESYGLPTLRLAEARAALGAAAYCYRFELSPESGPFNGLCVHTSELPLVFGNVHLATAAATGAVEPIAHQMAGVMHELWVDFISSRELLTADGAQWPSYTLETRETMIFSDRAVLAEDLDSAERQLWEQWAREIPDSGIMGSEASSTN